MKTGYAVRRPVTNAWLVRERDRRWWRDLWVVVLAILPVAVVLLWFTWIRLGVIESGAQIDRIESELVELRNRERVLLLEASRLESPERLELAARQQLGLQAPRMHQIVFVDQEGGR